jgi:shikimate dehydrogenase
VVDSGSAGPAARRAAVLGKPVAHSLSPVLHNAGYAALGLTGWHYTAIECAEAELADLVAGLGPEWAGLSLTMPLKEVALVVADRVSPVAAALGAANTLVPGPDGWYAENTDAPGMVDALATVGLSTVDSVAVLGAGGTARAALAAARHLGAAQVTVYARRVEAVEALRPVATRLGLRLVHADFAAAAQCARADLVISTVPKGVADGLSVPWRPETVVFDAIYDPWPTPLAATAQAAGCPIVSGLDLLLYQALGQFERFTGEPAPMEPMRAALFEAAARR